MDKDYAKEGFSKISIKILRVTAEIFDVDPSQNKKSLIKDLLKKGSYEFTEPPEVYDEFIRFGGVKPKPVDYSEGKEIDYKGNHWGPFTLEEAVKVSKEIVKKRKKSKLPIHPLQIARALEYPGLLICGKGLAEACRFDCDPLNVADVLFVKSPDVTVATIGFIQIHKLEKECSLWFTAQALEMRGMKLCEKAVKLMKETKHIEARANYMGVWYVSSALDSTNEECVKEAFSKMKSIYDSPGTWKLSMDILEKKKNH